MRNEEHHGFRNFVLFAFTLGLAWYLWKEREKIRGKLHALDDEPEVIIDVAAEEAAVEVESEPEENILEPAFITPTPIEDEAIVDTPPLIAVPDLGEDEPVEESDEEQEPIENDVESEEEAGLVADDEGVPPAGEPDVPVADEPDKPPTWVHAVEGECPEGFPIKARFATGHYHEPGDRGYEKIVPDCCYPTIEDAEADGFTPSRWS